MQRSLFLFFCFVTTAGTAQSVYPLTLNIGGGSYRSNTLQVDWSIAESASVQTFKGTGELLVSSGVLQPYTLNNEILVNNGSINWLPNEFFAYPVPTRSILLIDIKIAESGRMNLQLLDGFGQIHFNRTFDYYRTNGAQRIDLTALSPGVYYLNATLAIPNLSITRRAGAFKIIKL